MPDTDAARGYSAAQPHARYTDAYHASYNDYLWLLAMADGTTPPISARENSNDPTQLDGESGPAALAPAKPNVSPTTIEGTVAKGSPARPPSPDEDGPA
jgi:hypothetical protein